MKIKSPYYYYMTMATQPMVYTAHFWDQTFAFWSRMYD